MPKKAKSPARRVKRSDAGRALRRKQADALAAAPAAPPVVPAAEPGASQSAGVEPRNHRELAQAIFAKCNPVRVGRDLLESSSEKGASVRARVFETLADWQFGPQQRTAAPSKDGAAVRIIWNIPGPPRESEEDPK